MPRWGSTRLEGNRKLGAHYDLPPAFWLIWLSPLAYRCLCRSKEVFSKLPLTSSACTGWCKGSFGWVLVTLYPYGTWINNHMSIRRHRLRIMELQESDSAIFLHMGFFIAATLTLVRLPMKIVTVLCRVKPGCTALSTTVPCLCMEELERLGAEDRSWLPPPPPFLNCHGMSADTELRPAFYPMGKGEVHS